MRSDVFDDVKNTSFNSTTGPNFVVNIQPQTAIRSSVVAPAFQSAVLQSRHSGHSDLFAYFQTTKLECLLDKDLRA